MKQYKSEIDKEKRDSKRPKWLEQAISDNALLLEQNKNENVKAITDGKESV